MEKIPKFLFGFNKEVELLNGRIAMISFILLMILELFIKKGIISLLV